MHILQRGKSESPSFSIRSLIYSYLRLEGFFRLEVMVICCSKQSYVLVLLMDLTFVLSFSKIKELSSVFSLLCQRVAVILLWTTKVHLRNL